MYALLSQLLWNCVYQGAFNNLHEKYNFYLRYRTFDFHNYHQFYGSRKGCGELKKYILCTLLSCIPPRMWHTLVEIRFNDLSWSDAFQ